METWQVILGLVLIVAAGHAGWYLRGFVDEWRLRGVLRRVHESIERGVDQAHRGEGRRRDDLL
jgi:hypothetical protein